MSSRIHSDLVTPSILTTSIAPRGSALRSPALVIDRDPTVDVVPDPPPARWYSPLREGETERHAGSCRLTVAIDRRDASRTETRLFAPGSALEPMPPESAWVWVPRTPGA
jgi:hypothetical protein